MSRPFWSFWSDRRAKRRVELAALVLVTAVAGYLWTAPLRLERALRRASFDALRALSRREPDDPRVFYYLGVRLRDLGHLGPARAAFARAATLDPDSEEIGLAWGTTAAAFGSEQEAFAALSGVAQSHPNSAKAHLTLALFCQEHYALKRAYEEALAAVRCDPRDASAWRLAGVTGLELQEMTGAEAALQKAAALAPNDWRSHLALAQTRTALHRPGEALPDYQEASRLAPEQSDVTLALGQALLAQAGSRPEIETARQTLARAAQQSPNAAALRALGQAQARQEQWPEARQALEQAERLAPNDASVHFELARVYRQTGALPAAQRETALHHAARSYAEEKRCLGSQARTGNDPATRLKLARLLAAHGEFREAAIEYRQLIAHPPNPEAARRELAALERDHPERDVSPPADAPSPPAAPAAAPVADLLRDADSILARNRYPEAERAYLHIIARDPNSARAFQGLGLAMGPQGKTEKAFKALTRALKLDPALPEAQFVLARLYYDQGFVDEAARRMEILVRHFPDNPDYLHARALCYSEDTAHYLRKELLLRRAVRIAPDRASYRRDLAKTEAQRHRSAEAENDFRNALACAPDDVDTLVSFGAFLLNAQPTPARLEEAERLLRQAVASDPGNANALSGLGALALKRDDTKQAIASLQQALRADPNLTPAWYQLGRAYDRIGDTQRAADCRKAFREITDYRNDLSHTEELARANLKDPALRRKLARLYAQGGQNARAINQYQVYLSLNRNDAAVRQELDRLLQRLQAAGRMPSMDALNSLLLASVKTRQQRRFPPVPGG
jgi:tetratricopeptide (TPR) repeat protein